MARAALTLEKIPIENIPLKSMNQPSIKSLPPDDWARSEKKQTVGGVERRTYTHNPQSPLSVYHHGSTLFYTAAGRAFREEGSPKPG